RQATRHSTCATIACVRTGRLLPEVAAAADLAWELVVVRVGALDRAAVDATGSWRRRCPTSRRGGKPMGERLDFGEVAGLRVDVISETGWFDDARFKQDMADYGGSEQTQYRVAWDRDNAGGYAALLTITLVDGDVKK